MEKFIQHKAFSVFLLIFTLQSSVQSGDMPFSLADHRLRSAIAESFAHIPMEQ